MSLGACHSERSEESRSEFDRLTGTWRLVFAMRIALGVAGGIAAYKSAELLRVLQDRGVEVQVVMTRAACEFVRPLTFAALSGRKVISEIFGEAGGADPNVESAIEHIAVAPTSDSPASAPASAHVIAN